MLTLKAISFLTLNVRIGAKGRADVHVVVGRRELSQVTSKRVVVAPNKAIHQLIST